MTHLDIELAYDQKTIGVDLTSRVREKEDLEITAVHEGGHVLVAYYTKEADKIHKVTIIAKGQSGNHMGSQLSCNILTSCFGNFITRPYCNAYPMI